MSRGARSPLKIINAFDGKEVFVGGTFHSPLSGKTTLLEYSAPLFGVGTVTVGYSDGRVANIPLVLRLESIFPPRRLGIIPT